MGALPDHAARAFYEIEVECENWSTPHLERQIFTALHLRLPKSQNKDGELPVGSISTAASASSGACPSEIAAELPIRTSVTRLY